MKSSPMKMLVTVVLLAATLLTYRWTELRRHPDSLAYALDTIDREIDGWAVRDTQQLTPRVLGRLLPTSYLSRTYQRANDQLGLFIAFYEQQRAGESMHSPKHCLPGSGWEIWKHETANLVVKGRTIPINKYYIQNGGQRMLVFYWYQSKDRIVADEYYAKVLLIRDTMADGRTAGSIVRITVPDQPGASEQALAFAARIIPEVDHCFRS